MFSGFYESYFFKQVMAKSEKDAIIQVVAFCKDLDEEKANEYLSSELGSKWTVKKFWNEHELKFLNGDETVGYNLIWIRGFAHDLDTLN